MSAPADTAPRLVNNAAIGVPVLLLALLAMMTLRIPPFLLDVVFTFNITLALVVLLVAVYTPRPLDFGIFPTILLVATLLRLALNVASTRVVLLNGHEGGAAAGHVIQAFGEVVIGGNYVVGLVVFVILVIINFVVVTKGAGRISEVSARFTLDAMPGKQMAIDADLNAGSVTQEEARRRREEVALEADFYGAMDGASKFVRGDAVAGILILVINIVGGLTIGIAQHGLDFQSAARNYTLLTIGDGLVAQIPSLLLSTAAALVVTRMNSDHDVGQQVTTQMFGEPRALGISGAILFVLGLVPGMPHFVFISLGGLAGAGAWWIARRSPAALPVEASVEPADAALPQSREVSWDDVAPVDAVGLEVGYRLIPLVDRAQGGELLNRIRGVRRKLSQELGFLVPTVHIRDNLELAPGAYRVLLTGVPIAESEIQVGRMMAINPGEVFGQLEGDECADPAFGLPAVWIDADRKEYAEAMGYTVVDASTVVATHLNHVLRQHAHELLGHEEAQQILDRLAEQAPKLAEALVPDALPFPSLVRVLQRLLREQVSIRDARRIAETLIDAAPRSKDVVALTEAVRRALGRSIVQSLCGSEPEIHVMTLDAGLEELLLRSLDDASGIGIEPNLAEQIRAAVDGVAADMEAAGQPAVLLVNPALRSVMAELVLGLPRAVAVLSYAELPDNRQITIVATVGGGNG